MSDKPMKRVAFPDQSGRPVWYEVVDEKAREDLAELERETARSIEDAVAESKGYTDERERVIRTDTGTAISTAKSEMKGYTDGREAAVRQDLGRRVAEAEKKVDDAIGSISQEAEKAVDGIAEEYRKASESILSESKAATNAIMEIGQDVLDSIPDDYTELDAEVKVLKGGQVTQDERIDALEKRPAVDKSLTRRVENLEAAARGQLFRAETDSEEAYTKAIPGDVLPWGTLDKVGAKTLVWNQVFNAEKPVITLSGRTVDINGDSITISGSGNGSTAVIFGNNDVSRVLTIGHKYFITGNPSRTVNYAVNNTSVLFGTRTGATYSNYLECESGSVFTAGENDYGIAIRVGVDFDTDSESITFTPQVFDLTQMFGAGNEPATPEEFRAMFPADYYPYSEPMLMSFSPDKVVNKGRNMLPGLVIGTGISTTTGAETKNSTQAASAYIPVDGTKPISISGLVQNISNLVCFYRADKSYIGRTGAMTTGNRYVQVGMTLNGGVAKFDEETKYVRITQYTTSGTTGTINSVASARIMMVQEAWYAEYAPYVERTTDLSALVSKYFPDGMRSAGAVHDEIDLEYGVAAKKVGGIDSTGLAYIVLDAPVVTPIDPADLAGLTDLNVEAGGSLKFVNQHGDDYRVPLPNTETFMIRLGGAAQ